NWHPNALFLPEAEFAAGENVLPDPEIAAERLALLMQVERGPGPLLIIATRASLDQAAPKRGALQSALVQLRRGATRKMEHLLEQLATAGYERVTQVMTRGQFAVRGGIVDLYSWQAPLPVRLEFFGDQIDSLCEFDIDTQTSVRDLNKIDILLGAADDQTVRVRDYLTDNHLKIDIEPEENSHADIQISEGWIEQKHGHSERSRGIPQRNRKVSSRDPSTPLRSAQDDSGPEDFSGAFQDSDIGEFAVGDL